MTDPEDSAYFPSYSTGRPTETAENRVIGGIGRDRVPQSFVATVIDRMMRVPDAGSIATAQWLAKRFGKSFGPSTGANLLAALVLANHLQQHGGGRIVTLACDTGERYEETIYWQDWLAEKGICCRAWHQLLENPASASLSCAATSCERGSARVTLS